MASSSPMVTGSEGRGRPRTFASSIAALNEELRRDDLALADMRRGDTLELLLAGVPDSSRPGSTLPDPVEIERLEGPIEARRVPSVKPTHSKLRYFLDGTQRTLPVWRVGLVPVFGTITAAAILSRDAAGRPTVEPGTLQLKHALLLPRRAPDPNVRKLVTRADDAGMTIEDPLDDPRIDEEAYAAIAGNYTKMVEFAYARAKEVRQVLETDLLRDWTRGEKFATHDDWIVVDGQLKVAAPRAIGLVKNFTEQHLFGGEAAVMLDLPPGYRSTAFGLGPSDRWRSIGVDPTADDPKPNNRTLWYLRFWDAQGYDARHALVRVEAGPEVREADQIDELSAWLMAERTPRATADARWATLLYPVHYLEQILKRRLAGETVGWPG